MKPKSSRLAAIVAAPVVTAFSLASFGIQALPGQRGQHR